ncbi:MAG: energy transducer TonB [Betaproteobacteria bacterium]|nr:energy transducer TonB [Betaproteobacteria bacterium]
MAVAKDGVDLRPVRSEGTALPAATVAAGSRGDVAAEAGVPVAGERGGASAAAPVRESVSADAMRQYRLALGSEARRYKRYPRLARERGWEGVVEVTVHLGPAGASASLGHGSGFTALDDQAVEMIAQAARQTPVPEGLRGKDVSFSLPVQFSLDE